jgi:transcriptional regulator with XRE-family HTH domain
MPEWSEVLVVLRTVRDWSQKQLAAAMHVRTSTISDYERGEKTLSRPTLERMVTAMGYPLLTIDRTVSYLRGLPRPGAAATDAEEAVARQIDETAAGFGFEVEAFLRSLFSRVSEESRALADHEIARSLWFRLRRHPQPARLAIVQAGAEFWSPALCELLCEESVQAAADDADRAVEVAELAVAVARLTPGGEARRSRLLGRATGFLGNALRVRGDLPAADAAFAAPTSSGGPAPTRPARSKTYGSSSWRPPCDGINGASPNPGSSSTGRSQRMAAVPRPAGSWSSAPRPLRSSALTRRRSPPFGAQSHSLIPHENPGRILSSASISWRTSTKQGALPKP